MSLIMYNFQKVTVQKIIIILAYYNDSQYQDLNYDYNIYYLIKFINLMESIN